MSHIDIEIRPLDFGSPQAEAPGAILRHLAVQLGDQTNHCVEAKVLESEYAHHLTGRIHLAFYLVTPKLRHYSYRLFTIEHAINAKDTGTSCYPVTLLSREERICNNSKKFVQALGEVFSSPITLQIISALMDDNPIS